MRTGQKVTIWLAVVAAVVLAAAPAPCRAATLWDWLFPWRKPQAAQPGIVVAQYPVPPATTAVAPVAVAPVAVAPAAVAPVAAPLAVANYAPAATTAYYAAPAVAPQPVYAGYAPQPATVYRTQWVQVPVTVYRPVTSVDPGTGLPVTVMRPCTTTTWQARRVPAGGLLGGLTSVFYPPAPAAVAPAPMAAPGYAAGVYAAPAYNAPLYAAPPAMGPAAVAPPAGTVLPGAPAGTVPLPAEQAGDVYPAIPSVPAPSSFPAIPAAPPSPSPAAPYVPGGPSGGTPADVAPSLRQGEFQVVPQNNGFNGVVPNAQAAPKPPASQATAPALRPVPDPDSMPRTEKQNEAPALLNPRDRTAAAVERDAGVRPAVFTAAPAPRVPVRLSVPAADVEWDDTGWRGARP